MKREGRIACALPCACGVCHVFGLVGLLGMSCMSLVLGAAAIVCMRGAQAEVGTMPSASDERIQWVRYTGEDVIRIVAAEGVVTTIELASDETIKDFAMGDRDAWHAAVNGHLFVIKPKDTRADTNLTLFTERRNYLFQLKTTSRTARQVAYWVRLQYPVEEGPTPPALAAAAKAAERRQIDEALRTSATEGALNHDYWIVGAPALQPLAMYDNGRQTSMRFSAAFAMPAAFVVEADGTESLVDYHVEGDTLVLHRVADRILLRRGGLVAGLRNGSPRPALESSATGTASTKVERVIRHPEDR
jgi:type IV secretion system protein VirB9